MDAQYTVQAEAGRLLQRLLNDPKLYVSPEVKEAATRVKFTGYTDPWLPVPVKFSESISAISAFVAASAAAVAEDRYGIKQDIGVNTDHASLFLFGFFLPNIDGKIVTAASKIITENILEVDKYSLFKPIHRASTNQYKTKDGRFYHTHGSMNATVVMKMLDIPEQDVTLDEAKTIWAGKVAQYDAEELDQLENEVYRQAGTICYTPEEFFNTEHGKIAAQEPIAVITELPAPRQTWPAPIHGSELRPLDGIRVVDLSRAVAAPAVSKILAALGADVIKVSCPSLPDTGIALVDVNAGKRDVSIDLKTEAGKTLFRKIIRDADVLVDGYRPHALEKLGFHSESLRELNPSLIYVREDCYGYSGPWAHRSGWQQIADCTTGLAMMTGTMLGLEEPIQPLLPNADYQTGVLGAGLVIQALMKRTKAAATFNIDLSLCHYNIWLYRAGPYSLEQQAAILALHPSFKPRHTTDLPDIAGMLMESLKTARPGIFQRPEFYETISGKEWGDPRPINIIGAPFTLEKSTVGFLVPSGRRGWSNNNPTWVATVGGSTVRRETIAARRQPSASVATAPMPNSGQQFPAEEDALSVLALWTEDCPSSQSGVAGPDLALPVGDPSRAGLEMDSFDQPGYEWLSEPDLVSASPIQQLSASDVLQEDFAGLGGSAPPGPPLSGSCRLSHLSDEDLNYLVKKGVFDLPPRPTHESLLKAYFLFVHPFMPVLAEDDFWSSCESELKNMSLLLHRAMLFAACPFVSVEDIRQLGYDTTAEAQESLFVKARLLFDFETEENELALVGSILLLSYRSPRPNQKSIQKTAYWLALATSMAKDICRNYKTKETSPPDSQKLLHRLLWACAVRELTISLGSRNITELEPCLPELPPLQAEDMQDSTTCSKVYDKETKIVFADMFLSLTELTKLVAEIRLVKSSAGSEQSLGHTAVNQIVESLFGVEKASLELSAWRDMFAERFTLATTTSTLANLKMLVFHRNLALLLCDSILVTLNRPRQVYFSNSSHWSRGTVDLLKTQWQRAKGVAAGMTDLIAEVRNLGLGPYLPITMSPIAINSGIVHALQRPLRRSMQSSDRQDTVKMCINVLEEMQNRFPVVNDMITILYAAIQFAEKEVAAYSLGKALPSDVGSGKDLPSGLDQEMIVQEACIISKTIHFLDESFYNGCHNG